MWARTPSHVGARRNSPPLLQWMVAIQPHVENTITQTFSKLARALAAPSRHQQDLDKQRHYRLLLAFRLIKKSTEATEQINSPLECASLMPHIGIHRRFFHCVLDA